MDVLLNPILNYPWHHVYEAWWWGVLLGILGVDILLSGDNAMVIAMVCKDLPPHQRKWGMRLGVAVAIGMRLGLVAVASYVLGIPFVSLLGALYLLYVAIKMTKHAAEDGEVRPATSLWRAMLTVGLADAAMSWDNVAALTGLAGGDYLLVVFGIFIAIPFIVVGASLIMLMLEKAPWLMWVGALLLGGVAGKVAAHDSWLLGAVGTSMDHTTLKWALVAVGVLITAAVAGVLAWRTYRLAGLVREVESV